VVFLAFLPPEKGVCVGISVEQFVYQPVVEQSIKVEKEPEAGENQGEEGEWGPMGSK
jgi:hypothetical protein